MLKRHEDALALRFDAVTTRGWSIIEQWELYLWYDAARIGKTVWRDLKRRFDEDNTGELFVYDCPHGLLLIHSDKLMNISKKIGDNEGATKD